jgi:hypothetical protein
MSFTSFTGPRLIPLRGGHALLHHHLAQLQGYDEGILRIAEEADGGAVSRIQDDAVVDRDVLDGLGEVAGEAGLEADLLGDRLLGITDEVDEHHTADESAVRLIEHRVRPGVHGGEPAPISCGNAVTYRRIFGQFLV